MTAKNFKVAVLAVDPSSGINDLLTDAEFRLCGSRLIYFTSKSFMFEENQVNAEMEPYIYWDTILSRI